MRVRRTADPDPVDAEALLHRGESAFDRGDYPEAIRSGRQAIAAGAAARGHLLVGDAYYRLDRFIDAKREYEATLELEPTNAAARRRLELADPARRRTSSASKWIPESDK